MTQKSASQIITANDLLSGEVVYFTKSGAWSLRHADAAIIDQPDHAERSLEEVTRNDASVVGPYLALARVGESQTVAPVHFRDAFRSIGPSNRFIGKQASPA